MVATDAVLLPFALWTSMGLRLDNWFAWEQSSWWLFVIPPLTAIPVFLKLGLYRSVVRYMEDRAIFTIMGAVTLSVFVFAGVSMFLHLPGVPRGALLIYWLIAVLYIMLSRMFARSLLRQATLVKPDSQRVLIYGAGSSGLQMAVAFRNAREFQPVAFVDDKTALHGLVIAGLTVYAPGNIKELVQDKQIEQVVLAIPSASRSQLRKIMDELEPLRVPVKRLPGLADLVSGEVRVEELREVEVEDLLGRDPVPPRADLMCANIAGLCVMVTGAGGSIGSELCRQIIQAKPAKLLLFEQSELALYSIEQELSRLATGVQLVPLLGSVTDYGRLCSVLSAFSVETIYHAAAYKHVPMVEHNPIAGIMNNAFGTGACASAAEVCGVKTFVLISTDKAVRPTNVMGATKRLAEMILQAKHAAGSKTRFTMVRFGNVLGSSGSVVPLFKKQIRAGGPVTLTHEDINRYFMTIPEAAQLVIQAGAMGTGGDVFVLDMGEPVKIIDLARRMIHLSGLEVKDDKHPHGDVEIRCTGLRPGEKLYEELLIGNDVLTTEHPRILRAQEHFLEEGALRERLEILSDACLAVDAPAAFSVLQSIVEDFKAAPATQDLVVMVS